MASEFQLFDGKNLSSLFKDIYDNQQNKKKNIHLKQTVYFHPEDQQPLTLIMRWGTSYVELILTL